MTHRDQAEVCDGTRLNWLHTESSSSPPLAHDRDYKDNNTSDSDVMLRRTTRRVPQPAALAVPPPPPVPPDMDDGRQYSYDQLLPVMQHAATATTLVPLTPYVSQREITLTARVIVAHMTAMRTVAHTRQWPHDIIVLMLTYVHGEPLW